jgi:hypothetical protein
VAVVVAKVVAPKTWAVPFTTKSEEGDVVPMPTLPLGRTVNRVEPVEEATSEAAGSGWRASLG